MTELKKHFDNKFHCHNNCLTEFYQKKNKKRKRIINKYKHIKSNKQFAKKKSI